MTQVAPAPRKPSTTQLLIQVLTFLRNAAPAEFDAVIRVYDFHTDEVTVAVTEATPDNILKAQGFACHARFLLKLLEDVREPPQPRNPSPPAQPPLA